MVSTSKQPRRKFGLYVDADALSQNDVHITTESHPNSRHLISSGALSQPQTLKIVHPDSRLVCLPKQVGEIWIKGPHIAKGYWDKAEANQELFDATLSNTGESGFMRTGDLGFMYEDQLFITGREKDLIIIRGRNYYPQDIEQSVSKAHPAMQAGGSAAFGIEEDGSEQLVVVAEIKQGAEQEFALEDIVRSIQQEIGQGNDLQARHIVLLPKRKLLKTSSGKVQRRANKKAFLQGKFEALIKWEQAIEQETGKVNSQSAPSTSIDMLGWITSWMSEKLSMSKDQIDLEDPMTAYGVDSLMLAEFETEVSDYLGSPWPVRDILLAEPSIKELAEKGMSFWREQLDGK